MVERKDKMKILNDNILIKRDPLPENKVGSIFLPEAYAGRQHKVRDRGEIVVIGPKVKYKELKKGDRVVFGRFSYQYFDKEQDLILVKECDLLAIL